MTRGKRSITKQWSKWVAALAPLVISPAVLMSCGGSPGNVETQFDETTGSLSIALTSTPDIAGFLIDVARADGTAVSSQFVASKGSGPQSASFFALAPGEYTVTSTPAHADKKPAPECMPSSIKVTIVRGKTAEVTLIARCQAGRGGLEVTTGVNFEPELIAAGVEPSTNLAPCDDLTVSFSAADKEGDTISCDVAVLPGARVSLTPTPGSEPKSVQCVAHIQPPTSGDQTVQIRACDAKGCASLDIPLHVASGPSCTPACSDGNPCTTDDHNAEGICSHSAIPDGALCTGGNFHVKLLGINDFHGQIEGRKLGVRPVGGAAVLASYLKAAQAGIEDQTILVHAGDFVGASPPASALLQDEPSISFFNMLANSSCTFTDKLNPACNIVGTLGNHEFDEGKTELLRLLNGGNFATGPFLEDPYPGAKFPYVSSNVIVAATGETLIRPFIVKKLHGIPVGFIGAVLKQTPTIVTPTGVAGLNFIDEADAINTQVAALKTMGVHSLVVTIHQGGFQTSYEGPTRPMSALTSGPEILDIVKRLDDDIDVVVSGHTHAFSNVLIPNAHGKLILLVQAFSASTAYDDVDLLIDPATGDVVSKTAKIVTTFGDAGPGLTPDPAVAAAVALATNKVAPLVNQVFGVASVPFTRAQNAAGESTLGDLIADAQAASMGTQFTFMNPGGIRADLDAGDITFGELFTIQPFGNTMVKLDMTGAQIINVLEQQWSGGNLMANKVLQISGFDYTWDPTKPSGSRIVEVRLGGMPISPTTTYTVQCNNFLATGGDNFTGFTAGTNQVGGPVDLDALIDYVEAHTPIGVPAGGRILNP